MLSSPTHKRSPYLRYAKTAEPARINLASSAIASMTLAEFGISHLDLSLEGSNPYGYLPLLQALAAKSDVAQEQVVAAAGTSMANHLVLATLLNAGDDVLIENPGYGPLLDVAAYLGANVRHFPRRLENNYAINPEDVRRALTPRTKLIVLTNLHNPSGVLTPNQCLREIGDLAVSTGAYVLVDEVYMETMVDVPWRSAVHLGPQFIATGSLTKGYGLGALRCGWALCEAPLARRIWDLSDLFASNAPLMSEQASAFFLSKLTVARDRARRILSPNRSALQSFLDSAPHLRTAHPQYGTIVFPCLTKGNTPAFLELLRERYEVSVAPGSFFGAEQSFRIGLGEDPMVTQEGLARIEEALQHLS